MESLKKKMKRLSNQPSSPVKTAMRTAFFTVALLLCAMVLSSADSVENKHRLSTMRVFNRVVLLVKEQYVEPNRFDSRAMLLAALEAVEQRVPEFVVTEKGSEQILVQVGKKSQLFSIKGLKSLWDLSFKLRDIFRFAESNFSKDVDQQEVEYAAINGALSKLDPHSVFLEPKFSRDMKVATKGEFGGLGIVIGLRDGFLTVISPMEGTPADKAGIKELDRITKINENSTINLALDEAADQLRGKPGTSVVLTILRKGESNTRRITVVRDIIKVDSVSHKLLDGGIAYVRVKAFHGNTARDVQVAIDAMRQEAGGDLKGLIMDVRNNPGGLLDQSVQLADLFLDGGVVVVTQGAQADKREEEEAHPGPQKTKLPIVVLVNGGSASASEIVAGAIKNRDRGLVIGQRTFGKGSVQMLYDFPDKSALKLTIAQYLTPGNESIQTVGIIPDVQLYPVTANDKQSLSLFLDERTREENLEAHLDDKRTQKRKPAEELTYVSEKVENDELEKRATSSRYYDDYEIRFAKRVLFATAGNTRADLLTAAHSVVGKARVEETEHLSQSLKKFGIDWSLGQVAKEKTKISARVVGTALAKAGGTMQITIEVKNIGKTPVWRLYGLSDSITSLFADREFIYGKLMPLEKRSWTVEVKIPKDALTRRDFMRVKFKGNDKDEFLNLDVPLVIEGGLRPKLAHSYYLEDEKTGNGDGTLQVDEMVNLVVQVKNVGAGVAEEPVVLLKNLGDGELFIAEGRQKLKALKPGESDIARLSFVLRKAEDEAKLQLQLYDGIMGDGWAEKITIPVQKALTREKAALKKATPQVTHQRIPPTIQLAAGQKMPLIGKKTFRLQVKVSSEKALRDAIMFVNDKKIYYNAFMMNGPTKVDFAIDVPLKPGVNVITMMAREDDTYGQRESVTVFSDVGDPLAARQAISTH